MNHSALTICASLLILASFAYAQQPDAKPQADSSAAKPRIVQLDQKEANKLIIKKTPPTYPPAARRAGIQGEVVVRVIIGVNGVVRSLQVLRGPTELYEATITAVRQWRYKPYKVGEELVEIDTTITMNYRVSIS